MLGGTDDAYVREVSFIDPSTRRMKMYSVNLSLSRKSSVRRTRPPYPFSSFLISCAHLLTPRPPRPSPAEYLTVLESITYTPSHSSPLTQTTFAQAAEIVARGSMWKSFADKLEVFSLEQFIANAAKGKVGFENVLSDLWDENVPAVKARIGMGIEWPKGATATVGGEPRS